MCFYDPINIPAYFPQPEPNGVANQKLLPRRLLCSGCARSPYASDCVSNDSLSCDLVRVERGCKCPVHMALIHLHVLPIVFSCRSRPTRRRCSLHVHVVGTKIASIPTSILQVAALIRVARSIAMTAFVGRFETVNYSLS